MICDLAYAPFERRPALLDELRVEPAEGALLRHRRHNDARVIQCKRLIQPEEVGVAPEDGELRFAEEWGCGLQFLSPCVLMQGK